MILTILGGSMYALKILQRLSQLTLSNAFSKSWMKLINKGTFHSMNCCAQWCPENKKLVLCSLSLLNFWSKALSILLGGPFCRRLHSEWTKVLCLVSCLNKWGRLLRDLANKADALIQTVEITSWFQILVKIFLSPKDALGVSVFGNSAWNESIPGAFPSFNGYI